MARETSVVCAYVYDDFIIHLQYILQMVSNITSTVKELCASAAVKDAVSDYDRKMLITCAKEAEEKLPKDFNTEGEKENVKADIKTELIKNNIG